MSARCLRQDGAFQSMLVLYFQKNNVDLSTGINRERCKCNEAIIIRCYFRVLKHFRPPTAMLGL